jgi:hypothetical protein
MSQIYDQWIRKISLVVLAEDQGIDLSEFRIRFEVQNADFESPNNAAIRVYNLSSSTIDKIRGKGEFSRVVLNAGYENGNFGVIFDGTIVQFRVGRESNIDTYLDILAMDGDLIYNQALIKEATAKGQKPSDLVNAAIKAMEAEGGHVPIFASGQNVENIRGAVMFGLARTHLRYLCTSLDAAWSIQNGKINVLEYKGYLPGEVVELNRGTGVIGVPEQTDQGIRIICLINPRIRIGALVKLNNEEFNKTYGRDQSNVLIQYNQWAGIQYNAVLSPDGHYRVYAMDYEGDSRGQSWYCKLTCLAVDITSKEVVTGN